MRSRLSLSILIRILAGILTLVYSQNLHFGVVYTLLEHDKPH